MEKTITKKDAALIQLRRAIQLYFSGDFICAVTLAGAAEEILGRFAESESGRHALNEHYSAIQRVADFFGAKPIEFKNHVKKRNKLRNELKHSENGQDGTIQGYFKMEAQDLMERALINYSNAFGEDPKDPIIKKYISLFHE